MYKVIIADDEESIRNRLCLMLKKMSDVFEIVGVFENGFDALESAISLEPDLIVTDIKMPYISGIELIRQVKIELPLVKAIIISGYDSFDYAKEAISLGVVSYLSKPISFNEFKEALLKVKDALDNQLKNEENIKIMHEKEESFANFLRQSDLNALVTMKEPNQNFLLKLKDDGIDLNKKYQMIAIFDTDNDDINYEFQDLIFTSLQTFLAEDLSSHYKYYHFNADSQLNILILDDEKINMENLTLLINQSLSRIKKILGSTLSCGISDIASDSINYRKLYRHAKSALEFRTILGQNIILSYDELQNSTHDKKAGKIDENEYKLLSYLISYEKKDEVKEKINSFVDQICTPAFQDNFYFILSNILDSILKPCLSLSNLYQSFESQIEITKNLYTIKSKDALSTYLNDIASMVIKVNDEKRMSGVESSYDRIYNYVQSHFSNCDLSIEDVADELNYSISYISAILKKNNTSFTKLTTQARMKKAEEYLLDKDKKIISIAKEVGYSDPYYFSHCFKKYYGQSPDEYKKTKI